MAKDGILKLKASRLMAGRNDRAGRQGNSERDAVVREGAHGEARGPDLVGGRGHHQAAAARRRARAGRGVLVRRRVPQSPQACRPLGTLRRTSGAALALLHDCMCYPSCHVGTTTVLDGCAVLAGVPGVQGAPGEGGEQVRGGARHRPRHRLPRPHRGRRAGPDRPHQRPQLPLPSIR
jgi:hypothetical protein